MTPVSELTFEIRPSPETNDHEVRVLVDGRDVLDEDHMGIDPRTFFAQFSNPNADRLLIGRCQCGAVGCSDYFVSVERDASEVRWRALEDLWFERAQYEETIRVASNDFSWEDQNRRAERLSEEILRGCHTEDGFTFQWASARIAPMVIKLSFVKDNQQKLLEFGWDGATDDSATHGAECLKRQLVAE
jgi:hypothetical protein